MTVCEVTVRAATPADHVAIRAVNRDAFGRDDEGALVDQLRADGDALVELVALEGDEIVGHILFSPMTVGDSSAAALAPVGVRTTHQRRGVGSSLVNEGLSRCRGANIPAVIVLGHPDYYPRFGFSAGAAESLKAPFSGPAFMALAFTADALKPGAQVRYAKAFGIA